MKKSFTKTLLLLTAALFTFTFASCKEEEDEEVKKEVYAINETLSTRTRNATLTLYPEKGKGVFEETENAILSGALADYSKFEFTYTQNTDDKTMIITVTKLANEPGAKLLSVEKFVENLINSFYQKYYVETVNALKVLDENPTYENHYALVCAMNDEEISWEEFLNTFHYGANDNAATQAEKVTAIMEMYKADIGITDNDYDTFLAKAKESLTKEIELSILPSIPENSVFEYEELTSEDTAKYPTGKWFNYIRAKYDSEKPWYKQIGDWKSADSDELSLTDITIADEELDDIEWKDNFTTFTAKDDHNTPYDFTVTDNKDGTVTLSDNSSSNTITLSFVPEDLTKSDDDEDEGGMQ